MNFVLHDGDFATSSMERWSYAHRREAVRVPAVTLDRLCADWPRLDLVKIDAEGAEGLVWDGMQQVLRRLPHAAVVLELHLQRDPPQTVGFLHQLQRAGYPVRSIGYEGDSFRPTPTRSLPGRRNTGRFGSRSERRPTNSRRPFDHSRLVPKNRR